MRNYTSQQIRDKYEKLSLKEKNSVLYDAIENMQQYNGRSIILCIALSMGYENYEGLDNTYTKN